MRGPVTRQEFEDLKVEVRRLQEGRIATNTLTLGRGDGDRVCIRIVGGASMCFDGDGGDWESSYDGGTTFEIHGGGPPIEITPTGTQDDSNRTFTMSSAPDTMILLYNQQALPSWGSHITVTDNQFTIDSPYPPPGANDELRVIAWVTS